MSFDRNLQGSLQSLLEGGPRGNTRSGGGSIASGPNDFMMANYVSGMQLYGRMSAVRRFFILFVTFDLLFIVLFWLICVLVNGFDEETNIFRALLNQIVDYNIYDSMFDLVIAASARFFLLILFYSIIHINHWWLVALTTAGSCVFLIAKTLLYQWKKPQTFFIENENVISSTKAPDKKLDSSYPFEVLLILISFLIAWAEAWFVDFRVLPQEARARSIVEAATNSDRLTDNEDTVGPNMERVRDYLSHYTESVANFYSPLESPAGSDDEDFDGRRISRKLSPQDLAVISLGAETLQKSVECLKSGGWKLEKETSNGDTVHSKLGPRGTKIYMVAGIVDANPEVLFNETLQNFEKIPTWNKSLTKCKFIQEKVDSNTDVIYQVAAEGPGGMVSARDFVNVRHWKKVEGSWVSAGMAVVHPEMPPQKKLVRGENGPGCWSFGPVEGSPSRCQFHFLLDTDLKGWIPQYVLDQALTHTCTEFMTALRALAATLQKR